jgi:hypothetical protein
VTTILYPDRVRSAQHPAAELVLSRAAAAARKAPAVGGRGQWRWEITGDRAELRLPPGAMPAAELLVDSGAALHHAITVVAGEGGRVAVEMLPDPAAPDRLAVLTVMSVGAPTPAEIRAHRAVALRSSTIAVTSRPSVPATAYAALAAACAPEGATLDLLSGPATGTGGPHGALLVARGTEPAALIRLGRALSAGALAAAMERLAITVAEGLTADSGGRPAVRIAIGLLGNAANGRLLT